MELVIAHSNLNQATGETDTTYTFTAVLTAEDKAKAFPCGHTDKDLYVELDQACEHKPAAMFVTVLKVEELVKIANESTQFKAEPEGGNEPDPEL